MPRAPRLELAGGLHHVTGRAPKGLMLFRADDDRHRYLHLLGAEVAARGWSLRTYCLMGNHLHLLLGTPEPDLGLGIKRIHETFVRDLHRAYDGHGHLFGDRFHNTLVRDDQHLFACLRYIARNPVAAGLCLTPDDWRWSAHHALAGHSRPPAYLDLAATHDLIGIRGYRDMVDTTDPHLLDKLATQFPADWLVRAVDDHHIPIPRLAAHLGLGRSRTYERLSDQRKKGTVP